MQITTVGLDIAKRVFQLHGVDAAGKAVLRRKPQQSEVLAFFKALPRCLVGIEACGTAHYWAREISELGHEVRLMPPSYVASYVNAPCRKPQCRPNKAVGPGRTPALSDRCSFRRNTALPAASTPCS